jgi:hypothetical protein
MKSIIILLTLTFSTYANAEWFEKHNSEWWMVVYSKMQCSKAKDVGKDFDPQNLIKNHECVYEPDYSSENEILSIGCEKKLKTGFVFATNKENCDLYIEFLKEQKK